MNQESSKACYYRKGYPEPEHIYLGKSKIIVFTLFSKRQDNAVLVNESVDEHEYECVYDENIPLLYDVEFRSPFKEKDGEVVECPMDIEIDEWYLVKGVDLETARKMCNDFIKNWIVEKEIYPGEDK